MNMEDERLLDESFLLRHAEAPRCSPRHLRLGAFQIRSLVAGPGERAVIWVAGCLRRCPGCMKPELFGFEAGRTVSVESLYRRISQIRGIEGVTFSGGEPFEQALPLGQLARRLRGSGLSVLVYSGYSLAALRASPGRFGSLLAETDILVDGEYRENLPGPLLWRGSANQAVYPLTARGASSIEAAPLADAVREVQVCLTASGVRLSGFPSRSLQRQLARALAAKGVRLRAAQGGEQP